MSFYQCYPHLIPPLFQKQARPTFLVRVANDEVAALITPQEDDIITLSRVRSLLPSLPPLPSFPPLFVISLPSMRPSCPLPSLHPSPSLPPSLPLFFLRRPRR